MPNLEELQFSVSVAKLMENNVVSFEGLGLDYLPSIRRVKVHFWCDGAFKEDVEREEAALRDAIQVHPNRPALQTLHLGSYKERYVPSKYLHACIRFVDSTTSCSLPCSCFNKEIQLQTIG